jgi:VTC domain
VTLVPPALSPSLLASLQPHLPAYELKFALELEQAAPVEKWARTHLTLDPHGDPALGGAYRIHSLYLDTPTLDVFHRVSSHRRRKYRLRRYGDESGIYLERKTRSGDRVRKRRSLVPDGELSNLSSPAVDPGWNGEWFHRRVASRRLGPSLQVSYHRLAFLLPDPHDPARLTLDRDLVCQPARDWSVRPAREGRPLTSGRMVLELKYRGTLPTLFRQLLHETGLCPGSMSKYRRGIEVWRS